VDFCVTKDIPQDFAVAKPCFDLSTDHSPVLFALNAHALNQEKQPSLSNRHTNWDDFRAKFFNDIVQWAGWNAIPEHTDTQGIQPPYINKQKNRKKKKRIHTVWH
jgi:hypothetical protein